MIKIAIGLVLGLVASAVAQVGQENPPPPSVMALGINPVGVFIGIKVSEAGEVYCAK